MQYKFSDIEEAQILDRLKDLELQNRNLHYIIDKLLLNNMYYNNKYNENIDDGFEGDSPPFEYPLLKAW